MSKISCKSCGRDIGHADGCFSKPDGLIPYVNIHDLQVSGMQEGRDYSLSGSTIRFTDKVFMTSESSHAVTHKGNRRSALQDWVMELTVMQQSVLMAAVRGPDGIRKNHPVKVLMRWYRRSFLISAFERVAMNDPYSPGGGSFTGPLAHGHRIETYATEYLEYVDELPHHFQLHLMHAAQILGYYHPIMSTRNFWYSFYASIANDAHLRVEEKKQHERRLGDNEAQWREAEEVTAK